MGAKKKKKYNTKKDFKNEYKKDYPVGFFIGDPNKEKKDEICALIANGVTFHDACIEIGIDESTGHRWKNADASFASQVEASFIKYKNRLISVVNHGSVRKPEIALKILERKYPDEWGEKSEVKHSGEIKMTGSEVADKLQEILDEDDLASEEEKKDVESEENKGNTAIDS